MAGSSAAGRRRPAASRTAASAASVACPASATISASRMSEFGCDAVPTKAPGKPIAMTELKNVEHFTIYKDAEHCINQVATRVLNNGDIVAVYNEERFPYHHDSGQTLMSRSTDGGKTWTKPKVVLPWSATEG